MVETQQDQLPELGFSFKDRDVQECPFPAYEKLLRDAPVYRDPGTGFYVVSRHADIRAVLLDPETYSSGGSSRRRRMIMDPERADRIEKIYEDEGWVPGATLSQRNEPEHKELRAIWDNAFRPGKIKRLDPFLEELVANLLDSFIDDGHCNFVSQFAVPLPLTVICTIMGAPPEDIWKIKAWLDAWIERGGMMQDEEREAWSVRMEIEAQHYFQPIFERLRAEPDDTFFSDVVNTVIPEWRRALTDNELHGEMFADLFAAGAETTANALASGVKLLIEHPHVWQALKADPEKHMRTFIEEVVRLESPTQGLYRTTTRDVTLHGVDIPAGSVINMRFAAGNRDERQFECPADLDLGRRNAVTHLAFGGGTHHCVGAPLARREMHWAFSALVKHIDEMWFAPGKNDFAHWESVTFRGVKELHIEFRKA